MVALAAIVLIAFNIHLNYSDRKKQEKIFETVTYRTFYKCTGRVRRRRPPEVHETQQRLIILLRIVLHQL